MKWTVKLVAEAQRGNLLEQEVVTIEREDSISPATVGLTTAEGKAIMESLQRRSWRPRFNATKRASSAVRDVANHFAPRAITSHCCPRQAELVRWRAEGKWLGSTEMEI
jgi:hypothetical protein